MKNRFYFSSHLIFSLILSMFVSLSLTPSLVHALGFGEVKLFSFLDEPLDAEVELLGTDNFDPTRILVTLASAQEFKKAGLARPFLLSNLQFKIERKEQKTFVRVTSTDAIHQPYLEYLIDLSWPGGRLVRGYTLLLDPAPEGTLPLHERRPEVKNDHPAFKPNLVYTNNTVTGQTSVLQAANETVLSEASVIEAANDTLLGQASVVQATNDTLLGQASVIEAVNPQVSTTHQDRFEKLFDEKTGESFQQEAPPMTIVSTLPASKQGNAMPAHQPSIQPQAEMSHIEKQGVSPANQEVFVETMQKGKDGISKYEISKDSISKDGISLNKTQFLFAMAGFSLLTLFIALFIIISRKNKKDFNLFNFFGKESAELTKNASNLTNTSMPFQEQENDFSFLLNEASKNFSASSAFSNSSDFSASSAFSSPIVHSDNSSDSLAAAPFSATLAVNKRAQVAPVQNEMGMKLELARNYLGIDDQENTLRLLQDVLVRGSDWEKHQAQKLLQECQEKQLEHEH